jgi:NADH dehydrogenase
MVDTRKSEPERGTLPFARRKLVTVFGATGFLGHRIVQHLLEHNFEVRAVSRRTERAVLLFGPNCPGLEVMKGDVHDKAAVIASLAGAHGAVNAVSLYVERGRDTFEAVHVEAAARVATLARDAGVKRLVHISGIGADPASASSYIRARGRGEQAVQRAFPDAILIRPSVMFGLDDAFLTRLAKLVRLLPVFPMFGRGRTKLQPVFVEDVAEATSRLMEHQGAVHPCYELGGPRVYSYEELVRTLALRTGARTKFLPMPFAFWHALAWFAEHLPASPLTRNQVSLMRRDNVASLNFPGLRELAIEPTPIETIVAAVDDRSGKVQPQRHRLGT